MTCKHIRYLDLENDSMECMCLDCLAILEPDPIVVLAGKAPAFPVDFVNAERAQEIYAGLRELYTEHEIRARLGVFD